MIGCFDAKTTICRWRPLHAIQRADTDDNLARWPIRHGSLCCLRRIVQSIRRPMPVTPRPSPKRSRASSARSTSFSLDSLVTSETRYYDRFKDVVAEVNNARRVGGLPLPLCG